MNEMNTADSNFLVFLDYANARIVKLHLSDEDKEQIRVKGYEGFIDENLRHRLGLKLSQVSWMATKFIDEETYGL